MRPFAWHYKSPVRECVSINKSTPGPDEVETPLFPEFAAIQTLNAIKELMADKRAWKSEAATAFTRGFITGMCDRAIIDGLPPYIEADHDTTNLPAS